MLGKPVLLIVQGLLRGATLAFLVKIQGPAEEGKRLVKDLT
jgi:hypothetical protein